MLSKLEIDEIMEKTKDMREDEKVDFIYTMAYEEAMNIICNYND